MSDSDSKKDSATIVKTTDEARSATTGHNVRYVLALGTFSVILLFLIIYFSVL